MSTNGGEGGGGGMELVAVQPKSGGGENARAIVEHGKSGASGGVKLREDEEDLEVKLRRIMENVPVRVSNTSGSSAGSGSGDFHQYRQMRRREQGRVARMESDYQRRKELAEFELRREERLKAAEERTAKKRAKRQKKKQKKKEKKTTNDNSTAGDDVDGNNHKQEDSSDSEHSGDDYELKLTNSAVAASDDHDH